MHFGVLVREKTTCFFCNAFMWTLILLKLNSWRLASQHKVQLYAFLYLNMCIYVTLNWAVWYENVFVTSRVDEGKKKKRLENIIDTTLRIILSTQLYWTNNQDSHFFQTLLVALSQETKHTMLKQMTHWDTAYLNRLFWRVYTFGGILFCPKPSITHWTKLNMSFTAFV